MNSQKIKRLISQHIGLLALLLHYFTQPIKQLVFIGFFSILFTQIKAQAQDLKSFEKLFQKKEFAKIKQKLDKYLQTDSLNAGAMHLYSVYYLDSANTHFSLDSARIFIQNALRAYPLMSPKVAAKLEKGLINRQLINSQKEKIDSIGFSVVEKMDSEIDYDYFITFYPTAAQLPLAIHRRDSIAFLIAADEDTYTSYQTFFTKYPQAEQVQEAKKRYQKHLYEYETTQGTIESYERFLQQHPTSPHRAEAEEKLYYLFTTDNKIQTLERFLAKYPTNSQAYKAWLRIWHQTPDKKQFIKKYPQFPDYSLVERHLEMDTMRFIPFLENQKYGFMDETGKVQLMPIFNQLSDDYICGTVDADYVVVLSGNKAGVLDKLGKQIAEMKYDDIIPFGLQAFKVEIAGRYGLVHRGGFELLAPQYDDLEYISEELIKARINKKWAILSYNDRKVLDFVHDDIIAEKNGIIVLKKAGKFAFTTAHELWDKFSSQNKTFPFAFDSYETSHEDYIIVHTDGNMGVINGERKQIIPLVVGKITETPQGWLVKTDTIYTIYDLKGKPLVSNCQEVLVGWQACGIKMNNKWGLVDYFGKVLIDTEYDTLYFLGDKGVALEKNGKKTGYFFTTNLVDFSMVKRFEISVAHFYSPEGKIKKYFIVAEDNKGKKGMFAGDGTLIFKSKYDEITLLNDSVWRVEMSGKKGLINSEGKIILPLQYDGITYEDGFFALLKSKKFGLYDIKTKKIIRPQADAVLKKYGYSDTIFFAKKEKIGLINLDNKFLTECVYDEIMYWTDTTALVKQNNKWRIYNFNQKYYLDESFDNYDIIKNDEQEVILRTYRSSGYGLISNKQGRFVPEKYTQIHNIGTPAKPFYFVETHVEQAEIYVVFYMNHRGEIVRKDIVKNEFQSKLICREEAED